MDLTKRVDFLSPRGIKNEKTQREKSVSQTELQKLIKTGRPAAKSKKKEGPSSNSLTYFPPDQQPQRDQKNKRQGAGNVDQFFKEQIFSELEKKEQARDMNEYLAFLFER